MIVIEISHLMGMNVNVVLLELPFHYLSDRLTIFYLVVRDY